MKAKYRRREQKEELRLHHNIARTKPGTTPVEDPRIGMSAPIFKKRFLNHLRYTLGVDRTMASPVDYYLALSHTVRDRLMQRWIQSEGAFFESDARAVYYLSAEYLLGRQLANNLVSVGCFNVAREVLAEFGLDIFTLLEEEPEPGLGNGGLGRLAACYLDSLATKGIPAVGYGIRYEFGIFQQAVRDGWQVEQPDRWLLLDSPWTFPRPDYAVEVKFGGHTERQEVNGRTVVRWHPGWKVIAVPFDVLVPGYNSATVNTLCLWGAKASEEFDFAVFDSGDYLRAVEQKNLSENISKVLYPNDHTEQGRSLRLQQEYFFVSSSLQDIIRTHTWKHGVLDNLYETSVVQLNDTHPAIGVAELMRLLVDELAYEWDEAWKITRKTFAFTNHTLMPEAIERWSVPLFKSILPRHLEIIYEINHRHLEEVTVRFPEDEARLGRMSVIEEGEVKHIRMGHLACVGSSSVNGVAELHSGLVKDCLFRDFYEMWPEKFTNVTNGVTPRRWMLLGNPKLSHLITEKLGTGWITDLEQLKGLESYLDDSTFLDAWRRIKHENKEYLAEYIRTHNKVKVDPAAIFDVQVKRMHEYKRQLLNALHIITLYHRIKENPDIDIHPRVFIFAGKAAPGYYTAKLTIKLVNNLANVINRDPDVDGRIKVVFLENFNVSLGERVYPAADVSEQISTAGMEASGTGNMKFAMNGAITIGTLDGANIEIRECVGAENFFLFGKTVDELNELRRSGYSPQSIYESNPELRKALDSLRGSEFSPKEPGLFQSVVDLLLGGDTFFLLADYQAYVDCQQNLEAAYRDTAKWTRMSIRNVAHMGYFSSDRSIQDYCDRIWHSKPLEITLEDVERAEESFIERNLKE
jgi:starch phosphorylase